MASIISAGTTSGTALNMAGDTSGVLQLATNGSTTALTVNTSQNVGIGTTSPTAKLQVARAGGSVGSTNLVYVDVTSSYGGVSINSTANNNTFVELMEAGTKVGGFNADTTNNVTSIQSDGGHVFAINTGGTTERMRIDTSGNVGIGTTSPLARLSVSGGITATGQFSPYNGATVLGYIGNDNSISGGTGTNLGIRSDTVINFATGGATERMRIDSSGNLLVGTTSSDRHVIAKAVGDGTAVLNLQSNIGTNCTFYGTGGNGGWNAAATGFGISRNGNTLRSINAQGTINASGADYAEYMYKSGDFTIAKGDVCGINSSGQLTNVFAEAIAFVVKSTNPSYVGGDDWFTEEQPEDADLLPEWENKLEEARKKVDRIAFSGQVPVNVEGAVSGQYIIPVNDNGAIKGEAISNPTFEQYKIAVGKVIAIETDGRAKIIVKVA